MSGRSKSDLEVRRRVAALWDGVRRALVARVAESDLSHAEIARAAGVSETMVNWVLNGRRNPSVEMLIRISGPLNLDPSIRLFAGAGLGLLDEKQARIIEGVARQLASVWRSHPETRVVARLGPAQPDRPQRVVRGSVDLAIERLDEPVLVAGEVYSEIRKIDAMLRWDAEKAEALAASPLAEAAGRRFGRPVRISRLLLLRSTVANRRLVEEFSTTLSSVYPASTNDAVSSLLTGAPWPGSAIVWVALEGRAVSIMRRVSPGAAS